MEGSSAKYTLDPFDLKPVAEVDLVERLLADIAVVKYYYNSNLGKTVSGSFDTAALDLYFGFSRSVRKV